VGPYRHAALPNDGTPVEPAVRVADHRPGAEWPDGTKIEVLAPLVRVAKGSSATLFEAAQARFVRVRIDGETYDLADVPKLNRRQNHDIAVS